MNRFILIGLGMMLLVAGIFVFVTPTETQEEEDAFFLFELPAIKEMQNKAAIARFQFTSEGKASKESFT